MPVANIGTGPLTFADPVQTDLGAGFVLRSRPFSVAPNACDTLVLGAAMASFAGPTQTATFVLNCNDSVTEEKTLHLTRKVEGKTGPEATKNLNKEHKEHKDGKDHKEHAETAKAHGPHEIMLPAAHPHPHGPGGPATHQDDG